MVKKLAIGAVILSVFMLLALLFLPAIPNLARFDFATPSADWYDALSWIKENTSPDEVVVSWWDYGYWVEYIAEREAYITPSQQIDRIKEIAELLLNYNEPPLPGGLRYLIVDRPMAFDFIPAMMNWSGYKQGSLDESLTLGRRLFNGDDVSGYRIVYEKQDVKIYEFNYPIKPKR